MMKGGLRGICYDRSARVRKCARDSWHIDFVIR
jgi:hypothetical protein